ncbi:hypothetical protein Calla_0187 [Caldicellulosiruptor acetigenus 6A]|uniref:F-box domain-containing protein n=2 Tax=Caldicellulosiruptor acetigenus TaxID=301953 RepID=G2PWC3_9FIRM|nr:hypothetical protein Calla_0187 [Caldicellulosiruptor acetigenus 6A]
MSSKKGIVMELARRILEDIVNLPEELQKEVLEFIELKKKEREKEIERLMDEIIDKYKKAFEELAKK